MKNLTEYNSQIEFVNNENEFLNSSNEETALIILKSTEVVYGANDSCNLEYCDENNISYIHQDKLQGGGCIVGVKGNIFIDAKRKNTTGICLSDNFSKALCEFLKLKGLDSARTDNNDVLVDNFKVASGCETTVNNWQYMGYQISIYQDIELINKVCNKPMIKEPKGLNEYNISTKDIKEFCIEYWSNN